MCEVSTSPVEHWHEIIADALDALFSEVAKALLIHFYLMLAVWTGILDGLYYRQ